MNYQEFEGNRFPYSIVWTPIPLISTILPFVGHSGICTSEGIIHDFSRSYQITVDDMAFGKPTKFWRIEDPGENWDVAIANADEKFRDKAHSLWGNNCHSHVAHCLNECKLEGGNWTMEKVWWALLTRSKYTGIGGFFKTYLSFFFFIFILFVLFYAILK